MDIIICVAKKDCRLLYKNIPYVNSNLSAKRIFLITNKKNFKYFDINFCEKYNIILCDENELVPNLAFSDVKRIMNKYMPTMNHYGWYFQQFLKMGFALSQYAEDEYVVWDSDTFPLKKLDFKDGEDYLFTGKTEYHIPYFTTMKKLIGLNKTEQHSFIAEHMIFNVKVMQELIAKINNSNAIGETWYEKILSIIDPKVHQGFSEFETYGTYYISNYNTYKIRILNTMRDGGKLFGRGVTTEELNNVKHLCDTISFELQDFPPFPKNLRCISQIYYFWHRRISKKLKQLNK